MFYWASSQKSPHSELPFQLRMKLMWIQIRAKVSRLFDASLKSILLEPVPLSGLKNKLTSV